MMRPVESVMTRFDDLLLEQRRRGRLAREVMTKLGRRRPTPTEQVSVYADSHPDVFFVQIGSHDGRKGDPLFPHLETRPGWRGIMVEPVPKYFVALQELRGADPRFQLVRAAITIHSGTVEFTTVDTTEEMPEWADQLSSIDPHVVAKHAADVPALAEQIRTIQVPAMTFDELTRDVTRIDVLHIDTEGHDAAILDQVDLNDWTPDLILFEHLHLGADDRRRCVRRLRAAGYRLTSDIDDILGIRSRTR